MSTESKSQGLIALKVMTTVNELEAVSSRYAAALIETKGRFERAVLLSQGIRKLKELAKPVVAEIAGLQNSALGFLTDRKQGYGQDEVLECLIEATLRGVYPVGNEFNIISGRCYITKAGYARLVRELPGLTDLRLYPGVPKGSSGGAVVPFRATWRLNGNPDSLEREVPVRLNAGMGADGAIGKATRKMLASIYGQVTGSEHTEEEDEMPLPSKTDAVAAELAQRLNGGQLSQAVPSRTEDHGDAWEGDSEVAAMGETAG